MSHPKVAVYSPNGSISKHDHSHRSAWPKMVLASHGITDFVLQPDDSLAYYDEVWLYLGMEWGGALNLFGGASDENAERLLKILEAKNLRYLCLKQGEDVCPLLGSIAVERTKGKVGPAWASASWGKLDEACMASLPVNQASHSNVIVGDSHALCLYDGQSIIYRHDHKTLHGALLSGLDSFYPSFDYLFKRITLCFGNIDLQHHLIRLGGNTTAIELAKEYVDQASKLQHEQIEIMELLPVFDETRKIATPGFYKRRPWTGTWAERNSLRILFNHQLRLEAAKHDNIKVIPWPEYIFNEDSSFNQAYMEKPRGVHLSWAHRRETW